MVAPITAIQVAANGILGMHEAHPDNFLCSARFVQKEPDCPTLPVHPSSEKVVLAGNVRALSDMEKIACGAGAGVLSSTVYSPIDLICIQQQKLVLLIVLAFARFVSTPLLILLLP